MTEKPNNRLSRREILMMLAAVGVTGSRPAPAQDAAKMNPRSYKVLFENSRVRVLEYLGKPGLGVCGQGRHYHPEHLTIAARNGRPDRLAAPSDPSDAQTILFSIKGSDLAAFHEGRLTLDDARKKVQITQD